jgi:uncharacterized protein
MAPGAYRISVADLRRRLGQRRRVHVDHDPGPLAVGTSRTAGAAVTGTLVIESIQGGVSVSGRLRTRWRGECRRCLGEVEGEADIEVHEIYQDHPPPDSDIYELWSEDQLDLAPMIRESVLLALPLGPLCRAECQGPDPERFPAGVEGQGPGAGTATGARAPDLRWAALGQLRFDDD